MKKKWISLLLLITPMLFFACKKDSSSTTLVGNWTHVTDIYGVGRSGAVCFTIGDTAAFIGLGYNPNSTSKYLTDFYKYTVSNNKWTPIKDFKGPGRANAVAFSINGKGYVGTGYDGSNYLKDFWEYNPNTNDWKPVSSIGSTGRRGAIAFAINNNGYVGSGYNGGNYLMDFYKFTPNADTGVWTSAATMSFKRANAVAFVLDKNGPKGFVTTGDNNGSYLTDLLMYDPTNDVWTSLRDIHNTSSESYDDKYNIIRSYASSFVIDNKAYVTCGNYNGGLRNDTWEYDPSTDLWIQKTNFEGSIRSEAVGFSVSNKGFVGLGRSGYYEDFWQFKPNDEFDANN